MEVAKCGEKSYSRCTSRCGRKSALKIIRIGFEKPVAVYSICGVSPCNPQSHVGPIRVFAFLEKMSRNPKGTKSKQMPRMVMPRVETAPPPGTGPERTRPLDNVNWSAIDVLVSCKA